MSLIRINGMEYDSTQLTDAAKVPLAHIQIIDAELARLNAQIAIHKTARLAYERGLADALKQMEEGVAVQPPADGGKSS